MEIKFDAALLEKVATWGTIPIIILVVLALIYHWDRVEKFFTSIDSLIVNIFDSGASEALRFSIQSDINQAILSLDSEVPGLFGQSVRVRWLEEGDEHANVSPGTTYIRVKEIKDADNLFLSIINHLFDRALLVDSRPYIHGHILESIRLVLFERFLSDTRFKSAMVLFRENQYNPTVSSNKSIAQATNQLEYLDYQGLFTRVFLRECKDLPITVGIGHQSSKPKWELRNFLNFVTDLFQVIHNKDKRVDFEYSSSTISVAFSVLADEITWIKHGLDFYKKRTKLSILRGATVIYIVALGARNVKSANRLGSWLQQKGFIGEKFLSYYNLSIGRTDEVPAVCIRCEVKPQAASEVVDETSATDPQILINDDPLHQTVKSIVQDPDVQIIKSAWIKGYLAQVVVNSSDTSKNVMQICIGKNGSIGKQISRAAGDYVKFVEWSPDLREAVLNNLDTHGADEILEINLDPKDRFAYISVQSEKTKRALVGPEQKNLRIAEALTDFSIEIDVDPKYEIIGLLQSSIPEIDNGEISIVDLVILTDQEIRVLVKSDKYEFPAKICAKNINAIRPQIEGKERLYFCSYRDKKEEAIIEALYPLNREDVVKVIQERSSTYLVVVKNQDAMARAIGVEGAHVRAAGKLLKCWIQLALPDELDK